MRLRTQNILMILPLFLAIAAILGLSRYTVERREIQWGLTEEIDSYTTTILEFLRSETYPIWREGEDHVERDKALLAVFDRVALTAEKRLREIAIFDASGQKPIFIWTSQAALESDTEAFALDNTDPIDALSSMCLAELGSQTIVHLETPESDSKQTSMTTCVPIQRVVSESSARSVDQGQPSPLGILRVTMEAQEIHAHIATILQEVGGQSAAITVIGFVVVWLLSALIAKPIKSLAQGVVQGALSGAKEAPMASTGFFAIQETHELETMFDTMRSVLDESEARLNRSLIQGTQFRSRSDLARVYVEDYWQPIQGDYGPVEVAGGLLGTHFTGSFFGLVECPGCLYALTGRIKGKGELDPVVMASGAWSFLREALQYLPPSQAFEQAIDIFDFASLMCVCVPYGSEPCTVWSKQISELIPPSESSVSTSPLLMAPQMVMQQRQCRFRVGDSLVIHTYTEEIAAKIEIYFQRFRHLSPSEFLSELAVFLGAGSEGAVLFLKNRGQSM